MMESSHPAPRASGSGWITAGAIVALLGVGLGAFGAHGLDGVLKTLYGGQIRVVATLGLPAPYKYLQDFKTGAEYQMYHALAMIAVGLLSLHRRSRLLNIAGWCFAVGVLLFSGSLYALVLLGIPVLGAITPFGGVAFLAGWLLLAVAARPQHQ